MCSSYMITPEEKHIQNSFSCYILNSVWMCCGAASKPFSCFGTGLLQKESKEGNEKCISL